MGTKPPAGPARIAQRMSINQVAADRWQAATIGDDGTPVIVAEGPMISYGWIVGMLQLAAAAAAAHLAPVEAATREVPAPPPGDGDAGDAETVPATGPAAVASIVAPALEGLAAMKEGARRAGLEPGDNHPAANPRT